MFIFVFKVIKNSAFQNGIPNFCLASLTHCLTHSEHYRALIDFCLHILLIAGLYPNFASHILSYSFRALQGIDLYVILLTLSNHHRAFSLYTQTSLRIPYFTRSLLLKHQQDVLYHFRLNLCGRVTNCFSRTAHCRLRRFQRQ